MTLHEMACTVLGLQPAGADFGTLSFVELGGDSLRAMRLAATAQEELGLRLAMRELLGGRPLADVLAEAPESAAPASPADPARGDGRGGATDALSYTQRGMWLVESITGGSPYNLVFTCFVEQGKLDQGLLQEAFDRTARRHEVLRTVFRERDGEAVRHVLDDAAPQLTTVEHDGPAAEFEAYVRRVSAERGAEPFDLAAAPALRLLFFGNADGGRAVTLIAHHMLLDGTAVGLLLRELFDHYRELEGGSAVDREPAVSPAALVRHQEELRSAGEWERQANFWTEHLAGVPSVLELPADRQRPAVQDAAGERLPLDLGAELTAAVTGRARQLGVTPFAFLLGAFGLTLSRWTGTRRLLVGVPLLGRETSELARLVGVAGNLVPVRIDVDDDADTADYLRAVHHSVALGMDAGQLPFDELVAHLGTERTLGCHPLVQACFGMHDQLVPERLSTDALTVRVEEGHGGGSQFDLTLLVGHADPSFAGHVEYATAVWHRAEAEAFVADFRTAVAELAVAEAALEEVRCLAPERRALLDRLNPTGQEVPATSLDEAFRTAVRRHPDAVAVREGDTELTYTQLAAAVAEQARLLREAGVVPGDTVLVGLERSVAEAVAVLGAVSAGAAYVGVDLDLPTAHTRQITAKAAPAAALVPARAREHEALAGIPVVEAWEPSWPLEAGPDAGPDAGSDAGSDAVHPAADPERRAYIAFTSGSTGEPKGVSVPHRGVLRLVLDVDYVRLGPGERMLRLSPLAFDASTLELWGALLTGATLEIHPAGLPSPSELGAFLVEREVTVAWLTAGLFRLVAEFAPDGLGGLRQLLTGGDVVPHDHAARMLARHPGLVITNGYGPTENTTFTTTHTVRRPEDVDGPLPIGRPIPGTRVYILDERGRRVPPGAVGELYAAGDGLADGYVHNEAETARRFGHFSTEVGERLYRTGDVVRLDTRGRISFLGRADHQVKIRGYRIELSAISDVLATHPDVQDAVVVVTDDDSAGKRIVAAVVPAPGSAVDAAELRELLVGRLPGYMVPVLWALLDRMPVTANGKVDRKAIIAAATPARTGRPQPAAGADSAGADPTERVAALFARAIERAGNRNREVPAVEADTDFFRIGGTSLAAVQLIRLIKEELGVTLKLREFLLNPTPTGVHGLAAEAAKK
ncbi:amino acid adenylation domain-containing protein [Kitasatospora sp. NPDC001539]|uniref:non-ribosomal peptide synthetase n=1 Tax=Kitasatospora sp. NPDC001539 TaxID=3154384 RepID=UPI003316AF05